MARREGFYMTLPSDGSIEIYPENTLSHFTNRLVQPVDLTEGEWRVGMIEMIFSTTLDNITEEENFFDLLICQDSTAESNIQDPDTEHLGRFVLKELYALRKDGSGGSVLLKQDATEVERLTLVPWSDSKWVPKRGFFHENFKVYRIHFRAAPYPEPDGLIEEINEGIKRCMYQIWADLGGTGGETEMKLSYDRDTKKIEYLIRGSQFQRDHPYCIRFAESLGYKLGFGPEAFLHADAALGDYERQGVDGKAFIRHTRWLNVNYHCPNTVDLYLNLKEKYVYCDIVEPQLVGGNALKLLRVIPMTPQRNVQGGGGGWDPNIVQYLKLSKKYFDTVEIQVATSLGKPMPFNSGKTVVVLHFRRLY